MDADVLIVGAAQRGATIAEHMARVCNRKVLVIDKRDHIAGNVFDYVDPETGIRVGKYGIHMFHTNTERVWNYLQRFGTWKRWDHKVLSYVDGQFVPVPVNINTVNSLCNQSLRTEDDMREWLARTQIPCPHPMNSEDIALARVGTELYQKLFRPYTLKQWNKEPSQLHSSVLARIPIRTSFDDRYFDDKYQALPIDGYTSVVASMLDHPNITVKLSTDWSAIQETIRWKTLVFTGPIDQYFNESGLPHLEYRSLDFKWEVHRTSGYYQPASQVNYPDPTVPYTRIVEYKHLLNQQSPYTIITKETSSDIGEPYYPIPNARNQEIYEQYRALAELARCDNVHFIGRLASYKYFNMDQAIEAAIEYFDTYLLPVALPDGLI